MASGTINGSTGNQYIDAKVVWSSTPNTSTNKSSVTAALYYKRNNTGFTTSGTGTFSVTINGTKTSATKTLTITESAWVKAVEGTVTVSHNDDGTKAVTISASGSIPSTSLSSTSVSGSATLDTIPRTSAITSASNVTLGSACGIKWTPNSKSFRYKIKFSLGSWSYTTGAIHPNQTTAYTYTGYSIPLAVANQFPTAKSGTMTATLYTYSDSGCTAQVGSASKTFTVTIPDNDSTKPTATMTLSPVSSLSSPFNTLYILGRSKVDANFTDAEGKYGASIVSYKVSILGKNYGSPYTSEYLTTDGSVVVTGTIVDSRGFVRTYTKTITVIPYTNPRIMPASGDNEIVCARCDANGNLSDSGTYLKIKAKRSYSKVVAGGVQKNFCSIRYRYKADGGSYSSWTTILASDSASDEVGTGALLGGALLPTSSYVVQVGVVDSLGETDYTTVSIPTDKVYMHRAGSINSLGIGKYVEEENTIDVAEDITAKFRGKVIFAGEAWLNLGLSEGVAESESNCGRWGGTGCYYRVCAGEKHVYVAFNCAFPYEGSSVQINATPIPSAYRPDRNVYAMCATGGRAVARVLVNKSGYIIVDWIQILSSAEQTTSSTVKWIDGYIDYWT